MKHNETTLEIYAMVLDTLESVNTVKSQLERIKEALDERIRREE